MKPSERIENRKWIPRMEDIEDFVPIGIIGDILDDLHARLQAIEDKQIEK